MGSIAKAINEASKATGYHVLHDYQKKTVEAYMYLSGRDVFVSAPTATGKSLTFELAPYAFDCLNGDHANSNSIILVVVPLISLMKDRGDECSEQQLQDILDLKVKLEVWRRFSATITTLLFCLSQLQWTSSMIRSLLLLQESSELRFHFCLRNFGTKCLSKVNLRHWISPFRRSIQDSNKLWSFFGYPISSIFAKNLCSYITLV